MCDSRDRLLLLALLRVGGSSSSIVVGFVADYEVLAGLGVVDFSKKA